MLRHSVLFLWRNTATPEQKLTAKKGLAYLSYGCPSARFVDFGTDLHGGSELLLKVKPWKRTPLWHARTSGPLVNFDMALHVDFDDEDGLDAYSKCPAHQEVSVYNESVCRDEWTARVDWWYGGPPRFERGKIRHVAMYLWGDDVDQTHKSDVREAFNSLNGSVPAVRSLVVGDNMGVLTTNYDLIVDVQFADLADVGSYLSHGAYQEALGLAIAATKYEWTARITHTMAAG